MRQSIWMMSTLLTLAALGGCDGSIGGAGDKSDTGSEPDEDGDGYSGAEDCDDTDPNVHIDAVEVCDGIDNDCDAAVDANDSDLSDGTTAYPDVDGDGYGDEDAAVVTCDAPSGYVTAGGDCDDEDATVNPDGTESCSTTADDDCDGDVNDEGAVGCIDYYVDADADGFAADGASAACVCFGTDEFTVTELGDCADDDDSISPGVEEVCSDGIDQDCDSDWDECKLSAPGPVDAVAVAIEGINASSAAGTFVSAGPDIDGDGVSDLLVSVPGDQQAFIFTTAVESSTTLLSADTTINAVSSASLGLVRLVPDVTGDGTADLVGIATAPFTGYPQLAIWNAPSGGSIDSLDAELLLTDVSGALTADDLIAVAHDSSTAALFTVDTASSQLRFYNATATGEHASSDYTYGVILATGLTGATALDDIDGDGFDELAVQVAEAGNGTVEVLQSSDVGVATTSGDASWVLAGEDGDDQFGTAVATAGDLDGDGYNDLVIGAPRHNDVASNSGAVYVFGGRASLVGALTGADADSQLAGELRNDYAGTGVAGAGDLDADGNLDLAIGAPGFDFGDMDNPGAAYAVYGPFSGVISLNDVRGRVGGSNEDADLGTTIVGPADLNGDGYTELIIGAPGHDSASNTAAGSVWIMAGAGL